MTKIKVSISMEDSLFEEVNQRAESSNGNQEKTVGSLFFQDPKNSPKNFFGFRNKSHLIELAVKKFLDEKINEGGSGK